MVAAGHAVCGRVQPQVADLEDGRSLPRAAADQRAQSGEQHHERERLGQEVVGPGVERLRLLLRLRTVR